MILLDIYPDLSTLNGTTDPTDIILYAHQISHGTLAPVILAAFFIIVMVGSWFAQIRFNGRGKIDGSFAAAGFTTFGLALIMSLKNGLLQPGYVWLTLGIAVFGAIWILWPTEPQY